jgi:hypothetical protein
LFRVLSKLLVDTHIIVICGVVMEIQPVFPRG